MRKHIFRGVWLIGHGRGFFFGHVSNWLSFIKVGNMRFLREKDEFGFVHIKLGVPRGGHLESLYRPV